MLKRVLYVVLIGWSLAIVAAAGFGALGVTSPLARIFPEVTLHAVRSYEAGPYGLTATQPPGPIATGS